MADQPAAAAQDGAAPAKRGGMMLFVGIGLFAMVSAVTVGVVAFPSAAKVEDPATMVVSKVTALMPIPQILVNLADGRGTSLLQSTMTIEAVGATDAAVTARFATDMPRVQDLLIKVLSAYTVVDLSGSTNKAAVQARLVRELNEALFTDGVVEVTAVFFTEFVVQ